MKYRINKYQVIYDNGNRDSVKPLYPIVIDDYETERTKLKNKHHGIGKKAVGINFDYEEIQ